MTQPGRDDLWNPSGRDNPVRDPVPNGALIAADGAGESGLTAEAVHDRANGICITGHVGNSITGITALPSTGLSGFFHPMAKGRPAKDKPEDRPAWARRIASSRERVGLSQTRLGEKIGKSQQAVTGYETGKDEPDFATLKRIGAACRVSPSWLAFGDGDPDQGDAFTISTLGRYKHDRLFAFAFCRAAEMLAEEGLQADLAYTGEYAMKLLRSAQSVDGVERAEQHIRATVDAERAEIRAELKAMREKRL